MSAILCNDRQAFVDGNLPSIVKKKTVLSMGKAANRFRLYQQASSNRSIQSELNTLVKANMESTMSCNCC